MPQITLYLDDDTKELVERSAKASGISRSQWVATAIRRQASVEWPKALLEFAGSFPDFPLVEERQDLPDDAPRLTW